MLRTRLLQGFSIITEAPNSLHLSVTKYTEIELTPRIPASNSLRDFLERIWLQLGKTNMRYNLNKSAYAPKHAGCVVDITPSTPAVTPRRQIALGTYSLVTPTYITIRANGRKPYLPEIYPALPRARPLTGSNNAGCRQTAATLALTTYWALTNARSAQRIS